LEKYPPPVPGAEDESRLTPIHPIFLQACFAASCPDQALHLLRRPITSVHAPSAPEPSSGNSAASSSRSDDSQYKLSYLDHLTYTYLAGVILCLLCLWQEADGYLEMCATAPTHGLALSALQLEAAKKLILVQLIAYGKVWAFSPPPPSTDPSKQVRPLPAYAPGGLAKMLKQSPYLTLPKHYPSPPDNFPTQGDRKTFSQDNNMGLISIALEKSVRWRIIEMMNTYEVLSLYEVCIQVGLTQEGGKQKLREVLLSMIEEGEIKASLEIENGEEIVSFNNAPTFSLGGSRVMPSGRDIQALVHATQKEVKRLAKVERDMLLSKEFLTKVCLLLYQIAGTECLSLNSGPETQSIGYV
jgi:COP9 signalosome complex subunit 3